MTCHSSHHRKQTNVQIMSSASPDTLPRHTGELQGRQAECFARGHIVSGRAGVQIHVCLSLKPGFFPLLFFLLRVFRHLKGDSHLQPIGYLVFLLLILFKGQIPVLPHSSQTLVKVRCNQWDFFFLSDPRVKSVVSDCHHITLADQIDQNGALSQTCASTVG